MRSFRRLIVAVLLPLAACASNPAPAPSPPAAALPAESGRVYDISKISVKPELINRAAAARAIEQSLSGPLRPSAEVTVHVRMVIGTDGQTSSIAVVRSTNSAFDAPAMAVVRLMRFTPGKVGGVAVRVLAQVPVTFSPRK